VRCVEAAANGGAGVTLNNAGRLIRNIVHAGDIVMSHILHFYHLSAADFIDFTAPGCIVGIAPWVPQYTDAHMVSGATSPGTALIGSYVAALDIRRKCHTMISLFSGKQPCQAAIIPGGATTQFTTADVTKARTLLTTVRNFIDSTYIPNVVAVATIGALSSYWDLGAGCGNLLSYGDFPSASGTLLLKQGLGLNFGASTEAFNAANIREYVGHSYYNDTSAGAGYAPFDGETDPSLGKAGAYSWLKAPRYLSGGTTVKVCEVGPLARMAVTHLLGATETVTSSGGLVTAGSTYSASTLITTALGAVGKTVADLFSVFGRHAARMLECKFLADAMDGWLTELNAEAGNTAWVNHTFSSGISSGYGLAEAPRGALGHWIIVNRKKIAKYQCVVPTTWNGSPMDDSGNRGPTEQAIFGENIGTGTDHQIATILRLIHPFDYCIACAVHLVSTDGKDIAKFAIDLDGKVTVEKN